MGKLELKQLMGLYFLSEAINIQFFTSKLKLKFLFPYDG